MRRGEPRGSIPMDGDRLLDEGRSLHRSLIGRQAGKLETIRNSIRARRADKARRRVHAGRLVLLPVSLLLFEPAVAQPSIDPSGLWQTETGISRVRIAPCGGGYCGTLAATGGSGLDSKNPNPTLRERKLVGIRILEAGQRTSTGFEGSLYNPSDGKTYAGTLTPKTTDTIEVSGCVLRVICKSQIWRRLK